MWEIRNARIKESEELTNLAAESEAYWGYDEEFMEVYKIIYTVTADIINDTPTYVLENENEIIGFYNVVQEGYLGYVEYFYIKPRYMGQGYGRIMWNSMVDICENLGIIEIELVTSPQAKNFYTKLGAIVVKEVNSQIDNRKIPKLRYKIKRKIN